MAEFQVVAVYPSGNRYPITNPHTAFLPAEFHRYHCELTLEPGEDWTYEIDLVGGRQNVDGVEGLGFSEEEIESVRENVRSIVQRSRASRAKEAAR